MRKILCGLMVCGYFLVGYAFAHTHIDGIHVSGGTGRPDGFAGGRLAFLIHWDKHWFAEKPVGITGYWDIGMGHWRADPDKHGDNKHLTIVAFAPVFRIIPHFASTDYFEPYIDASVGFSVLSNRNIGRRHLGWNLVFQDLVKVGARFGTHKQFDVGYHFIFHYSNADIFPPNHGITVKEHNISLTYWFT